MKTNKQKRLGVKGSILIPVVLLNVIVMGLLGLYMTRQSYQTTKELAAEIAGVAAEYAAASVDPELLPAIVEGAEETEEYQQIMASLKEVMSKTPILYCYTLTTNGTDVFNGVVAGFEEKIGTKSNVVYSHVAQAFAGTTVQDSNIHETAFGQLINSYVPIKDDNGQVLAILGCAYNAEQISLGLNEIKLVVENSSNTAQNSAAASEELSGQANMMEEMVMQFQI